MLNLLKNVEYFIAKIDEIWRENYTPTFRESLMVRKHTVEEREKSFVVYRGQVIHTFVDVGGTINGMCIHVVVLKYNVTVYH